MDNLSKFVKESVYLIRLNAFLLSFSFFLISAVFLDNKNA